jgi:hypothetical protein
MEASHARSLFRSRNADHQARPAQEMASRNLDGMRLFAQESLWLSGYDTSGFCFFQCRCRWNYDGVSPVALTTQTEELRMSVRLQIAALIYMMVQAVSFGVGTILVLATPLKAHEMALMPWVIIISAVLSAPVAWYIAPRLRARYWRQRADLAGKSV